MSLFDNIFGGTTRRLLEKIMNDLQVLRDKANQQSLQLAELNTKHATLTEAVTTVGTYVRSLEKLVIDLSNGTTLPPAAQALVDEAVTLIDANAATMAALGTKVDSDTAELFKAGDGDTTN